MTTPYYAPFIDAPPLTCCEDAFLTFGQGTPPYTIFPIASGSANASSLEAIPVQSSAGVYQWRVDFNAGANLTWFLRDSKGQQAYSVYRVVQAGAQTTCPKNPPAKAASHTSSTAGPIAGGVIGGVALILLVLATFLILRRRRQRRSLAGQQQLRPSSPTESEMTQARNGARGGLVRAGTFNLHNVEFTEPSMDHLRSMDAPPQYVPPSPRRFGRRNRNSNGVNATAMSTTTSGASTPNLTADEGEDGRASVDTPTEEREEAARESAAREA